MKILQTVHACVYVYMEVHVHVYCISKFNVDIPVLGGKSAWILNSNDNKDVLELRSNTTRGEGFTSRILKYHCHDIISNVTFSQ